MRYRPILNTIYAKPPGKNLPQIAAAPRGLRVPTGDRNYFFFFRPPSMRNLAKPNEPASTASTVASTI